MDSPIQPDLIVNELLCYSIYKLDKAKLNVKALKSIILSFFSLEVVAVAKDLLVNSIDSLNVGKWPRPPRRRTDSKETDNKLKNHVDDLVSMLSYIEDQKLFPRLPVFVAVNIDMIPSDALTDGDASGIIDNLEEVNNKLDDIVEKLSTHESMTKTLLDNIIQCKSVMTDSAKAPPQPPLYRMNRSGGADFIAQPSRASTAPDGSLTTNPTSGSVNPATASSSRRWEGQPVQPTASAIDDDFSETISKKRRRQLTAEARRDDMARRDNTASESEDASNLRHDAQNERAGRPRRDASSIRPNRVGLSTQPGSALKAASDLVKRKVFCVNNASCRTTCEDMTSFIANLQVRCLSCFDAKSHFKNAKAFRICINDLDKSKFLDMNMWPTGIVIRDWSFKGTNQSEARNHTADPSTADEHVSNENAMHVVAEYEASAFDSSSLCADNVLYSAAVCGQLHGSDINNIKDINLECHSEINIVNTSNVIDGGN